MLEMFPGTVMVGSEVQKDMKVLRKRWREESEGKEENEERDGGGTELKAVMIVTGRNGSNQELLVGRILNVELSLMMRRWF